MSKELKKITFKATTGYVGSEMETEIEFDKEEWNGMSESEKWNEALIWLQNSGLEIWWKEEDNE